MISGLIVATGIISLLGILFAEPLTRWIAGGYAKVPGKLELTITLTRIMFPFLTLVAVAVAFMGMLNSLQRFFIPAMAPAMFNVGAIVSVFTFVTFVPQLGWDPMVGLALGTLLGGVLQMALQWPVLRREGFRFRFTLNFADSRLREILLLMAPGTIGLAAVQINQLVNVALATGEQTGAVTYLSTAFRLIYLPIGLFGVSIATAALPTISRHAAADDSQRRARFRVAGAAHDAHAERARDVRPGRARAADSRTARRIRQGDARRHRRRRARAHLLRARPRRLLLGEDCVADVLCVEG